VIALATVVLGVLLFTLYLRAYRAAVRGDDKTVDRYLAMTGPLWLIATFGKIAQHEAGWSAINGALTMTGVWAWSSYRDWDHEEEVAEEPAEPEAQPSADVVASHPGGDAS
jgi:hypothetical protein